VVRLSADAGPPQVVGVVEHVASGSTARFEALEELGAFMAQMIAGQRDKADPQTENVD